MRQQLEEFEEIAKQNDDDVDIEIAAMQSRYEKKVRSEREEGARLKGENGIMRKKFNTFNKDIDDIKTEMIKIKEDEKKLRSVISSLEKDIFTLKKDVSFRNNFIIFHWMLDVHIFARWPSVMN